MEENSDTEKKIPNNQEEPINQSSLIENSDKIQLVQSKSKLIPLFCIGESRYLKIPVFYAILLVVFYAILLKFCKKWR